MAQRFLTDFELLILLAILKVGDEAYGVPVAREVEAATGREVSRASVYAALDRLEQMGLVTTTLSAPTPIRGGRSKRLLKVSGKGVRAVRDAQRAFTTLWRGLPALKGSEA
jgi:DNA-binding PadR family transcriptional regulator